MFRLIIDSFRFRINRIKRKFFFVSENSIKLKILNTQSIYPKVMSIEETIELLKSGYSLSRFGDGEFNLCFGQSISFQSMNLKLMKELRRILNIARNDEIKFIVAIPRMKFNGKSFWSKFWYFHVDQILTLMYKDVCYADLGISRHIELFHVPELINIWSGKNVLFVFGKNSKFNLNHEIFLDIQKTYKIESEPSNAFKKIENILSEISEFSEKIDLVLISLGPTASILAYECKTRFGIQSIDLGHLTNVLDFKAKGITFKDGK